MSSEITVSTKVSVANGKISGALTHQLTADQATKGIVQRQQSIPTSDTVITLTGVTAARWASIRNTDATNYIDIGPTVAGAIAPMFRLKAGEVWAGPLVPSVVLRGQANTAAVIIEVLLLET